ncbi:MAG: UDP-N-acetylglucosamine 1-carboxyvinyltransferase [Candidatus Roizmanbacteria bacterium]|nr:MAG: UDP-N-acetylglucosamine 1-carboxyvinyltransferase [Candidatus Roizmanbacteria bacterium]
MEDAYIVKGGKKLKGNVVISGAKNVALKAIIASLLFEGYVILENVPRINDVDELMNLIRALGAKAAFSEKNKVKIDSSIMDKNKVDLLHASKIRVSFMLFAPLLHRFKKCYVPNPGGCRIGARPIDRIIEGMKQLGVKVNYNSGTGFYKAEMKEEGIKGEYTFGKPSHTGTEILIMLSALGKNKVILNNTALEPEVDELIKFLNESGADIKKEGSRILIKGVSKLVQKKPFQIMSDRNEAVTFAVLAVATKGEVTIEKIPIFLIEEFIKCLKKAGGGVEIYNNQKVRFFYHESLNSLNIETSPHPGFMTDWQPNWAVLMTQAKGESIIHERVFENRFSYVNELKKLGAKIEFIPLGVANPKDFYNFDYNPEKIYQQAIKITGHTPLHNAALQIKDLRAGASLIIAALVATGESVVQGASIVERGYEDFEKKVQLLGGKVKKI